MVSSYLKNMIYDHCGDADVKASTTKVYPALKFYYNMPLMMNSNERIEEHLANGTPCRGLYLKLRHGATFKLENWEGYMVNTVFAHEVEYIVCRKEKDNSNDPPEYFKIETRSSAVKVNLRTFGIKLCDINVEQFPVNDNSATTGHKLQGVSLDNLVISSWDYGCPNWIYVVLSRLTQSKGLVLCERLLDDPDQFRCPESLMRWEENLRQSLEVPTFAMRGEYGEYFEWEDQHA